MLRKVCVFLILLVSAFITSAWSQPNAGFSITGLPSAGVIPAGPSILKICQGTKLTLHNTSFETGGIISSVLYSYKKGKPASLPRLVGSFPDQQVTFNSLGFDTIWQTVTDALNRTSKIFQPILVSDVYPDSVFSYTPAKPLVVCGTSLFTFTARNQFNDSSLTFYWSFQGSNTNKASGSPVEMQFDSATGTGTGNYQAKLFVINGFGCTSASTQNVAVSQIPDNTIFSTNAGPPPSTVRPFFPKNTFTICGTGDSVFKFVNNSSTASTNAYYHIEWGNGKKNFDGPYWLPTDTLSEVFQPGYDTLKITITGANTCVSTAQYTIYRGGAPVSDLSANSVYTLCEGDSASIKFGAGILKGPASTAYSFNIFESPVFDTTINQNNINPAGYSFTHIFNQPSCGVKDSIITSINNSFNIYFKAVNACGLLLTQPATVHVSALPSVLINAPLTVCNNSSAILSNITNWTGVYPYCGNQPDDAQRVWTITPPPGGSYKIINNTVGTLYPYVSGDDSITVLFTGTGVYHARLYVKSTNALAATCVSADSSNFSDAYICVRNPPKPDFTLSDQSVCAKKTVFVTTNIDSSLICGQDEYKWTAKLIDSSAACPVKGKPVFSDSLARFPSITFPAPGLYNITLTVSPAGSTVGSCVKSITHAIQVYDRPGIKFNTNTLKSICPGDSINPLKYVQIDSCFVPGSLKYSWWESNLPDTSFNSANPGYMTFNKSGNWYINLSLSSVNSCGDTSAGTAITVTDPGFISPVPDLSVCSGSVLNLKPSSLNHITGFYWKSEELEARSIKGNTSDSTGAPGVAITDTLVNTTSPPTPAVVKYFVYATGGGCRSNTDTVIVTVMPTDSANAGPDQFICKGADSCFLNAVPPKFSQETGTWSQLNQTAVIVDIHNPKTKITGLKKNAKYIFTWTINNPGAACSDTTDNVSVFLDTIVNSINQPPLLCSGDSVSVFGHTPSGVDSLDYTYKWLQSTDSIYYTPVTTLFSNFKNITVPPPGSNFYSRIAYYHGCSDTSNVIGIHFVPSLNKPSFTESALTGCGPFSILFKNQTKQPPTGNFSFQWLFGDSAVNQGLDTVRHTFYPTLSGYGDTSYRVVLNATNGCLAQADTAFVFVRGAPKATFTPDLTSGCSPMTVEFSNNSVGSNVIYSWNFDDGVGNQISNSQKIFNTFHVSKYTGFRVKLLAGNDCGNSSDSATIVVNANTINLNFGPVTPTNNGCTRDTVMFKNNTTGGNVFTWAFGDGSSVVTADGFGTVGHRYQLPGLDTVKLCAANGCTLDTCTTKIVNIKQSPKAVFTASPTDLCTGGSVTTVNLSQPTNALLAYKWSFGDGTGNYEDKSPVHTYSVPGTDTIWLAVSVLFDQGFSCTDSASKVVTINGPSGILKYPDSNCTGNVVAFQLAGGNATAYKFDFGDYTPPKPTSTPFATHSYIMPGIYLPKVTLTTGTCNSIVSGADSLRVDKIEAAFKYDSLPLCDSTTMVFTDSSFGYFGISAYQWLYNSNEFDGSRASGTFTQTNTYPVTLKVTGITGCTSQITTQVFVYVHQTPAGAVSVLSDTCARDAVHFKASVFSNDPVRYTWDFGNGDHQMGLDVSTIFNQPGFYNVNLSAFSSFGCTDVANYIVSIKNTPVIKVITGSNIWQCAGETSELKAYSPYVTDWIWGPANGLSCINCGTTLASPANTTLYTVTGINDEGCSAIDTVIVNVQKPFKITVDPHFVSICTKDSVIQPIQLFASGADKYFWTPATWLSDNTLFNPVLSIPNGVVKSSEQLLYHVTGYDNHFCFTDTTSFVVSVGINPTINLGLGNDGPAGRVINVSPVSSTGGPFKSYAWSVLHGGGTITCLNNICDSVQLIINSDVTFKVTAVSDYGCVATDTIHYTAYCGQDDVQVYIPNAFSPDGDGINDVFMVQGKGIMVESFKIFNRWGQQVFDGGSNFGPGLSARGWDGTFNGVAVGQDVYVFIAKVKCTAANTSYFKKGSVTLIRVKK